MKPELGLIPFHLHNLLHQHDVDHCHNVEDLKEEDSMLQMPDRLDKHHEQHAEPDRQDKGRECPKSQPELDEEIRLQGIQ